MTPALDRLNTLMGEVLDLRYASGLLGWDERVCMPPGGVPLRGQMLATIQRLAHERFTSPELGHLLDAAAGELEQSPDEGEASRIFRITRRDYDRATRVPPDYVTEHAQVTSAAHEAWKRAREQSDTPSFSRISSTSSG